MSRMLLRSFLLLAAIFTFMVGCATTNHSEYQDAATYWQSRIDTAQTMLSHGAYILALDYLEDILIGLPPDSPQLRKFQNLIREYPACGPKVIASTEADIAKPLNFDIADSTSRRIETAAKLGAISDSEIRRLKQSLSDALMSQIDQGTFKVSLTDLKGNLPVLLTPNIKAKAFKNSLELLKHRTTGRSPNLGMLVCETAKLSGDDSKISKELKSALPHLNFTKDELACLASLFPEEAAKKMANMTIPVHITFDPPDRLTQEDIISKLKNCKKILLVSKSGPRVVDVKIAKLKYELRHEPERTQTIMYQQYQVNFLSAAFLMPKNATYQYEYVTGGTDLAYAFEIKASRDKIELADKLLRDSIGEMYGYCKNPRIQNVFGGIQPASFVSNDDMARRCNSNTSTVNEEELRDTVINRLAQEIQDIDAIKNFSVQ